MYTSCSYSCVYILLLCIHPASVMYTSCSYDVYILLLCIHPAPSMYTSCSYVYILLLCIPCKQTKLLKLHTTSIYLFINEKSKQYLLKLHKRNNVLFPPLWLAIYDKLCERK